MRGKRTKKGFKKIKKKQRKIKEIKKEKSELEKDTLEEIIEDTGFKQNFQSVEIPAPVLTKVETPAQEQLESDISFTPISSTKETEMNYIAGNEPKYSNIAPPTDNLDERKYESEFRPPILRQTEPGRLRQEILTPPREVGIQESQDTNRIIETNVLEQKRREPFEVQEKKYRKVEL